MKLRKIISLCCAVALMLSCAITTAAGDVLRQKNVSTITTEELNSESVVYIGEIIVDGESALRYLYPNGVVLQETYEGYYTPGWYYISLTEVGKNLKKALSYMNDSSYSDF